jgi:hypothetical protein
MVDANLEVGIGSGHPVAFGVHGDEAQRCPLTPTGQGRRVGEHLVHATRVHLKNRRAILRQEPLAMPVARIDGHGDRLWSLWLERGGQAPASR